MPVLTPTPPDPSAPNPYIDAQPRPGLEVPLVVGTLEVKTYPTSAGPLVYLADIARPLNVTPDVLKCLVNETHCQYREYGDGVIKGFLWRWYLIDNHLGVSVSSVPLLLKAVAAYCKNEVGLKAKSLLGG